MAEFEKGTSGNAAGRPAGKTPATLLRKSIAEAMPEIITVLIQAAKDGDTSAAKVLLDRVCPALKSHAEMIEITGVNTLQGQGSEIIKATMSGQIPPDIGAMLINALSSQGKLIELVDMQQRLSDIEKQLKART